MQNYLAHHGIKDQKWYVRRFQNEDGSLTPAGKERYGEWNPGKRKKTTLKEVRNKDGSYRYNIESEDGSKVGNISTYHQSDDSLRVSWISVDKNHKREGYASGAMDTLFNQAREKGYKKVTVVIPKDDANVQHIYERLGFKPSSDGLTNDEVADSITSLGEVVKMEYELKHSDTLDDVLDDYLMHYGVGPDDNPPGRGSGRYAKGSGERPYQHDENKDAGEKKKGLFSALGAIHKALNPGFSAVDKAAEEAGRKLKEKEEAAKKAKDEKVEYDTDRPQLMKEIDSPDWHDKSSVEKIKSIEKEWLNTDGDYIKYAHDPEYRKSIQAIADLGLKAVDKLRGPRYVDFDEGINDSLREWFFFEDQTTGMPAVANFINKGYSAKQVKYIIDEIEKANDDPATKDIFWNNHCTFQVWEGNYDNELKTFAQYCENIKFGDKGIKHSDLLDDFLAHYGVGPDDNPPGRGSGRYAKGTGENPYQHDDAKRAQMKKRGLFGSIQTALAKRKANTEIDRYRDYVDGMLKGSLKNNKALQDKYKELARADYDGDRPKLAAEWKKFSEEVVDKHAKAEAKSEALNKAREAKAAKQARDAEKAKAIATGDPEQISKWLSEMSNQEQIDAINRIKNTQDIKDKAAAQVKAREDAARAEEQRIASQKAAEEARRKAEEEANRPKTKEEIRKEKYEKFMTNTERALTQATRIRDMAEKGIDIWNTIAAFNNTFNEEHEMPMIKRTDSYFKEKADKEAARIKREQQLEDNQTKRENDLADALRKEKREDEKWRKEFIAKNGMDPDDIKLKEKETSETNKSESKSSEPKKEEKTEKKPGIFDKFKKKDKSKEETEAPKQTSNEPEDWYTPAQSIARRLLTSTAESRKEAAEAGTNYWKSISDWANDPTTERESNAAYNRDRANENARYNEWEANEQKNAAQRIANEERARREAAEKHESESASREARLKREAQQYKFAQTAYEEKIKARDLDREHNNGDNWRHHDEQVKEAREKLDEIRKDYNLFRKYL